MITSISQLFKNAAQVQPEWGPRPWGAYMPSPGPIVPGAQPKICVVLDEDGKYRVPVREEDTPEYRADMIAHWVGQAVGYVSRKPVEEWCERIRKFTHYLHSTEIQMSESENALVMNAAIDQLLARPELAERSEPVSFARLEYIT